MHGLDFHSYLPRSGVPVLATIHLPPAWYAPEALQPRRRDIWLHGVSALQHRAFPPSAPLFPPIENGVPVERLARTPCRAQLRRVPRPHLPGEGMASRN